MGQGLDRLLDGRMSLWEYGAVMHGWKERQPKDPDDSAPNPDDEPDMEEWAQASVRASRLVRAIDSRDKG